MILRLCSLKVIHDSVMCDYGDTIHTASKTCGGGAAAVSWAGDSLIYPRTRSWLAENSVQSWRLWYIDRGYWLLPGSTSCHTTDKPLPIYSRDLRLRYHLLASLMMFYGIFASGWGVWVMEAQHHGGMISISQRCWCDAHKVNRVARCKHVTHYIRSYKYVDRVSH